MKDDTVWWIVAGVGLWWYWHQQQQAPVMQTSLSPAGSGGPMYQIQPYPGPAQLAAPVAATPGLALRWQSPNVVASSAAPAVLEITGPNGQRLLSPAPTTSLVLNPAGGGLYHAKAFTTGGQLLSAVDLAL